MALLSLQQLHIEFGGLPLLDGVDLNVEQQDRICILGANGAGKSTLLKIMGGIVNPDAGEIVKAPSTKVAFLPQEVPQDAEGSAIDVALPAQSRNHDGDDVAETERILKMQRVDPRAPFNSLSGGNRRKVLIAGALAKRPDVLLLDEPTNHLDIESIQWLEANLPRFCKTWVFVTHDRMFLRRMATRIVELDRGRILDWACDYDTFLRRKEDALEEERRNWERFDAKLKMEEAWLRQGVKARTHRNQGRLRHLMEMRKERAGRRTLGGASQFSIQEAERSGSLVLKATDVSFAYSVDRPIFGGLSLSVRRGDRIGVVGPNGCGKTTLVRVLFGDGLAQKSGDVRRGTNLAIVYSDQLRTQLDDRATLTESVAEGREFVMINGVRRHILGYLGDFLFSPDRARQKVGSLSGGERSRLLMAKLFAQPSNVLVLDEPTNDLDMDTLDLLEEQLDSYGGTVVIVSHDREFLNNTVTSLLAFEKFAPATGAWLGQGDGWSVNEYVGGFDDWVAHRPAPPQAGKPDKASAAAQGRAGAGGAQKKAARLTFNERRELAALPDKIAALESEQAELRERMADPKLFTKGAQASGLVREAIVRLEQIDRELLESYERWDALETRASQSR